MQTISVFIVLNFQLFFLILSLTLLFAPFAFGDTLTTRVVSALMLIYWVYVTYETTPERGGLPLNHKARSWTMLRLAAEYFPVRLEREGGPWERGPQKRYVVAYHPHGIIGIGAQYCFGSDVSSPSCVDLFPGIDFRLLTLNLNFKIPFLRTLGL